MTAHVDRHDVAEGAQPVDHLLHALLAPAAGEAVDDDEAQVRVVSREVDAADVHAVNRAKGLLLPQRQGLSAATGVARAKAADQTRVSHQASRPMTSIVMAVAAAPPTKKLVTGACTKITAATMIVRGSRRK